MKIYMDRFSSYNNESKVTLDLSDYDNFRKKETSLNILLSAIADAAVLCSDGKSLAFNDAEGKLDHALQFAVPQFRDDLIDELRRDAKDSDILKRLTEGEIDGD